MAEVGFISCKDEREKLISSEYQERVAKALEHGVILYLAKQNELSANQNLRFSGRSKEVARIDLSGEDRDISMSKNGWLTGK